jgi:hypothetical protein
MIITQISSFAYCNQQVFFVMGVKVFNQYLALMVQTVKISKISQICKYRKHLCFASKMLNFHNGSIIFNCFLQIEKAEFSCPSWFPVGTKSLIHRILDPNPQTVSIGSMTRHCFLYLSFAHSLGCV